MRARMPSDGTHVRRPDRGDATSRSAHGMKHAHMSTHQRHATTCTSYVLLISSHVHAYFVLHARIQTQTCPCTCPLFPPRPPSVIRLTWFVSVVSCMYVARVCHHPHQLPTSRVMRNEDRTRACGWRRCENATHGIRNHTYTQRQHQAQHLTGPAHTQQRGTRAAALNTHP